MNRRTFLASLIGLAAAAKTKLLGAAVAPAVPVLTFQGIPIRLDNPIQVGHEVIPSGVYYMQAAPMTATEVRYRREEMRTRFDELRREHETLLIEQMTEALKLLPRTGNAVVYNRRA